MSRLTLRRNRQNRHLRALTRETLIDRRQLIQPLFVVDGLTDREPVPGLKDVWRETGDSLLAQIEADLAAGQDKFLLFGVPAEKRERDFDVSFTRAHIAAIKQRFGDDIWLGKRC